MRAESYDAIVVGAGICGAALAHSLARQGRKVMVIERDLSEPDTFRGELLQPGGIKCLKELGLEDCVEGIDGYRCYGYVVYKPGETMRHVPIDYPLLSSSDDISKRHHGVSFHHGRFVQNLRKRLSALGSVELIEGNVTSLIEKGEEVCGVTFKRKGAEEPETALAHLTIDCTGSFSRLRARLTTSQPSHSSHFVALLLRGCALPYPNYGYVTLADPAPVLCYQIATDEVRMLIGIPDPLPSVSKGELKRTILDKILPQLPEFFHEPVKRAAEEQLRSVPCRILHTKAILRPGGLALGDSLNMRHPLTGGGMTVAFTDVCILSRLLGGLEDLSDKQQVLSALEPLYSHRRNPSSTINILSLALYEVFCGASSNPVMGPVQEACFDYFPRFGTACLAMLGGLNPSPYSLIMHFFAVAFYAAYRLLFPFPTPARISDAFAAIAAAYHIIKPLIAENYLARPARRFGEVQLTPSGS